MGDQAPTNIFNRLNKFLNRFDEEKASELDLQMYQKLIQDESGRKRNREGWSQEEIKKFNAAALEFGYNCMAIKQAVKTQRYANVYNKVHRYIRRFDPETATAEQA